MGAHIEWLLPKWFPFLRIGILRVGKNFKVFGDPFEFACTVFGWSRKVTFKGATSECTPHIIKERNTIRKILIAVHVREVQWVRRINGKDKWFKKRI